MSPAVAKLSHAHAPAIPTTTPSVEKIPPTTMPPTAIDHVALKLSLDLVIVHIIDCSNLNTV